MEFKAILKDTINLWKRELIRNYKVWSEKNKDLTSLLGT